MTVNTDISRAEIEKMSLGGDIENVEYTKAEEITEEEIRAEKR
jgi:hypothetical protein